MLCIFEQTLILLYSGLRSLPLRLGLTLSMVLSIALAVSVLAGFLALAAGFERALQDAGSSRAAVVLESGSREETASDFSADVIRAIAALPGDFGAVRDPAGALVLSRETVVPVETHWDATPRTIAFRGMDQTGPMAREGITLVQGRFFSRGSREIVVGERMALEFPALRLGKTVRPGSVDWTVTGYFSTHGNAFESELWGDLEAVRAAFNRQGQIQSLRLRLETPQALTQLTGALTKIAPRPLTVILHKDLYAAQSERVASAIRFLGWPIALLMAAGASVGALNAMMIALNERALEIATVPALGFARVSAFAATLAEAIALAFLGALPGALASWLLFNGWQASTIGANNAHMSFHLAVTGEVILQAILLALAIGAIAGSASAFAAIRAPLASTLKAHSPG